MPALAIAYGVAAMRANLATMTGVALSTESVSASVYTFNLN